MAGSITELVEHMFSKCKALNSTPVLPKVNKKDKYVK
jgi:hypothetical protein